MGRRLGEERRHRPAEQRRSAGRRRANVRVWRRSPVNSVPACLYQKPPGLLHDSEGGRIRCRRRWAHATMASSSRSIGASPAQPERPVEVGLAWAPGDRWEAEASGKLTEVASLMRGVQHPA